jgi:hypothetical protein
LFAGNRKRINDTINEAKEETVLYVNKEKKRKEIKEDQNEKEKEFIQITSFFIFQKSIQKCCAKG